MSRAIGGYFELEMPPVRQASYHPAALALSTGRACLSLLLQCSGMRRVWVPFYSCNSLLAPLQEAGVAYEFYAIDEQFRIENLPRLGPQDGLIYVNYFGLQTAYVHELLQKYGDQLIVDNTQDFFAQSYGQGWSFNSARKFFGVPDGAYLYGPQDLLPAAETLPENDAIHTQHLLARLAGQQQVGYAAFAAYEQTLDCSVRQISALSAAILARVDFDEVAHRRRANFQHYHTALAAHNQLSPTLDAAAVPFSYPFLPAAAVDRGNLFGADIFVPWLWRDTLGRPEPGFAWERRLSDEMLPLPVDQRYQAADVARVVATLLPLLPPNA